jgi:hypothetical protein
MKLTQNSKVKSQRSGLGFAFCLLTFDFAEIRRLAASGTRYAVRGSRFVAGLLLLLAFRPVSAMALPKPTYSLNFGGYGELDGSSDSSRLRHPAQNWNFSLDGSLSWTFLNLGLNLLYTSDDKFTAQRINQINFNPSWKWGRISAGDFSPFISPLTLSGVSLYGAGLELFPGAFRLTAVGGRTKRASTDSLNWSYNQYLYGFRLGAEQFSITALKALDDTTSNRFHDSALGAAQDNVVLAANSRFNITRFVSFDLEAAGSALTRDLRSDTVLIDTVPVIHNIPNWVYRIYQPRYSSRAGYALRGTLKFSPSFVNLAINYNDITPGYTSLGTSCLKNDYRDVRFDLGTSSIPKTSLALFYEKGRDNLLNDKLATTTTTALGGSASVSPITPLSVGLSYNRTALFDNAQDDSFRQNSITQSISFTPNLNLQLGRTSQSLGLITDYEDFRNRALSGTPPSTMLTLGLNYSITPGVPITLSTGISHTVNLSHTDTSGQPAESYQNFSLSANKSYFSNKLTNNVTIAFQPSSQGSNYTINGSHGYSLTQRDVFNFTWNLAWFRTALAGSQSSFNDKFSLSYNRRFF